MWNSSSFATQYANQNVDKFISVRITFVLYLFIWDFQYVLLDKYKLRNTFAPWGRDVKWGRYKKKLTKTTVTTQY